MSGPAPPAPPLPLRGRLACKGAAAGTELVRLQQARAVRAEQEAEE
jgi:hypothetical protein